MRLVTFVETIWLRICKLIEATERISKALKVLQSQRLSVCVNGEVDVDKTKLVNALVRHTNLLPVSYAP